MEKRNTMIRIVIADDQRLMRDGLHAMINSTEGMEVVGLAENGQRTLELVIRHEPDLVLMDIQMPELDGIAATRMIRQRHPQTRILILTTYAEDDYIIDALLNGASGFLYKDLPAETIISSIQDTMTGTLLMPNTVTARLASRLNDLSPATSSSYSRNDEHSDIEGIIFTGREKDIIGLMVEGKGNREIANLLFISEGTMRNYISVIYNKIGTNARLKAVNLLKEWLTQK